MAIMPLLALCIPYTVDIPILITLTLLALFMLLENVRPKLSPRPRLILKLGITVIMDTIWAIMAMAMALGMADTMVDTMDIPIDMDITGTANKKILWYLW